jgi:heterodisulfide reductase subunit B2
MTAYAYYPGCSLHGTGIEYAKSTEAVCRSLGIELRELEDWNCCGSSSGHTVNPWLGHGLVGRNLKLAAATGLKEVVLPCAACYARFKETSHALGDPAIAARIDEVAGGPVPRDLAIEPLLKIVVEPPRMERLQASVVRPLHGLKVAPYYGCLLVRPPDVTHFDDPEDPQTLDQLMRVLGAEVVTWSGKTACCGSNLAVTRNDVMLDLSHQILKWAEAAGANAIVTACPMCHSNLDTRQGQMRRSGLGDHKMPVYYFTELMGVALGLGLSELGIPKHLTEAVAPLSAVPAAARS